MSRPEQKIRKVPGARKSHGEYKPLMVTEIHYKSRMGEDMVRKETKVLGQDVQGGAYADGTLKQGRFGHYRGLTFPTREEALEYARARILVIDEENAYHDLKMAPLLARRAARKAARKAARRADR